MIQINPLLNYWVCLRDGEVEPLTIAYTRSGSINLLEQDYFKTWENLKEWGWECVEVNISFEPITK